MKHTVFILFGQAPGFFIFEEQTSQTVETTGVGQECEASLFSSVGSVRPSVRSFVRSFVIVSRLSEQRICPIFSLDCWNAGQYADTLLRKVRQHPTTRRRLSDDRSPLLPVIPYKQVLSECAGTYMSLPGMRLRRTESRLKSQQWSEYNPYMSRWLCYSVHKLCRMLRENMKGRN